MFNIPSSNWKVMTSHTFPLAIHSMCQYSLMIQDYLNKKSKVLFVLNTELCYINTLYLEIYWLFLKVIINWILDIKVGNSNAHNYDSIYYRIVPPNSSKYSTASKKMWFADPRENRRSERFHNITPQLVMNHISGSLCPLNNPITGNCWKVRALLGSQRCGLTLEWPASHTHTHTGRGVDAGRIGETDRGQDW